VDGLRSKGEAAMEGREVRGAFAPVQDCRAGNGNCSRGIFLVILSHVTCADQVCLRGRETGREGSRGLTWAINLSHAVYGGWAQRKGPTQLSEWASKFESEPRDKPLDLSLSVLHTTGPQRAPRMGNLPDNHRFDRLSCPLEASSTYLFQLSSSSSRVNTLAGMCAIC
jgi:hypothetical protein